MERIRYWLQRADYTSTEYDPVDVETAIRILQSHDWPADPSPLEFQREREAAGVETCPPGIGFVADETRILHICPGREATAVVHYHTDEPRLRVRTSPLIVGFAGVVISSVTAWRLLNNAGNLLGSFVGAVAGIIGLFLLRDVIGRLRHPSSVWSE